MLHNQRLHVGDYRRASHWHDFLAQAQLVSQKALLSIFTQRGSTWHALVNKNTEKIQFLFHGGSPSGKVHIMTIAAAQIQSCLSFVDCRQGQRRQPTRSAFDSAIARVNSGRLRRGVLSGKADSSRFREHHEQRPRRTTAVVLAIYQSAEATVRAIHSSAKSTNLVQHSE